MNMTSYIDALLQCALENGITSAEAYYQTEDSFSAMCVQSEIANYSVSETGGLSLRGLYKGKMGYASTEAFDEASIMQLVQHVKESAELIEDDAEQFIFEGSKTYQTVDTNAHMDKADEKEKLNFLLDLEKKALSIDKQITQVTDAMIQSAKVSMMIKNTYGLNLKHEDYYTAAYVGTLAKTENSASAEGTLVYKSRLDELNADTLAQKAVKDTLFMLSAKSIPSGTYRAILDPYTVMDLLGVFSGVFSAENAQTGLSLLKGKEGEKIASPCVTIVDDPLLKDGISSCPFDAEGVATYKKNVVENGVLQTLLHNLKTAKKDGVQTTGNAAKGSYASPIRVAPTNFYIEKGEKTLPDMMQDMQNGIVITNVEGLHAGANPISGDFSLSAKGYLVKEGKKGEAVNQITVAGNFYTLLQNVQTVGSDLTFMASMGSPSLDVGEISIAGC